MKIIYAAAVLQILTELADSGFIIGNVINVMNGLEPMDSDGLFYEYLLKKAVQRNPKLENIDDDILNKAEEELFRTENTRALVEESVSSVREYLEKEEENFSRT